MRSGDLWKTLKESGAPTFGIRTRPTGPARSRHEHVIASAEHPMGLGARQLGYRALLACATLAVLVAACGKDDGGGVAGGSAGDAAGASADVGFGTSVQPLFELACNCHQSTPLMAPFSLEVPEAYDNLVEVPSAQLPTMNLVTPGKLNESYLWHKLEGTQLEVGGSGDRMPSTIPLDEDQKAIVARWISAGAPP